MFHEQRTELVHGGQRPVGGMVYRRSKGFPQVGQSSGSLVKAGEAGESSSGRGERVSDSRSSRRLARSRR